MSEEALKPTKIAPLQQPLSSPPYSSASSVPSTQAVSPPSPLARETLFGEIWRKRWYIFKAAVVVFAFWLLEFAYQYYFLIPGELNGSLVRSFALTGATFIGLALCIGTLAVLLPKKNFIYLRRTFGVAGFTLVLLHIVAVMAFLFKWEIRFLFFELNPYKNPIMFGVAAFFLFIPLYVTSTDWAIKKLSYPVWKNVHRLVYFAFVFAVLHYTQINPDLLYNPAGYLLIGVTLTALVLELAAFVKKLQYRQAGKGAWIGAGITLFALILFLVAFAFKKLVA